MAYFAQVYKSTDLNSPPLSGQSNSLIVLMNACLVDGYGWDGMSLSSITRSGTTATATVSAADGLKLKTGQILTISGATGGDAVYYNGTFTITVASTTTFTYKMSGTPGGSATGTPVASSKLIISSITRSGTTATVTLRDINLSLETGQYFTIEGCTGGDATYYNGTFAITVVDHDTFTYTMTGTPSGSATGSPVYYKAGLQWTRPFAAGTNSQTYRSADTASNQFYCQIIDNSATAGTGKEAQLYGAEVMSADQAVTSGRFPTVVQAASGLCMRKSTAASSVVREWTFWGDSKTWYYAPNTGDANGNFPVCGFGHFISLKPGDAYNTFCCGAGTFNTLTVGTLTSGVGATYNAGLVSMYVARSYTQVGTSTSMFQSTLISGAAAPSALGSTLSGGLQLSYPNYTDNGIYVVPLYLMEPSTPYAVIRGRFPSFYPTINVGTAGTFSLYDEIDTVTGLTDVTLMFITCTYSNTQFGWFFIDKFGPWT